jgi:hypothetical protein
LRCASSRRVSSRTQRYSSVNSRCSDWYRDSLRRHLVRARRRGRP